MENSSAPASAPAPLNSNSTPTPAQAPGHEEDYGMPDLESPFPAAVAAVGNGNAENPIAVDLASQIQNLAPEVNWTETETLSETEDDEFLDINVDSFADELLVRNLMDLINPHAPSNVLSLINDFANTHSHTQTQTSAIDTSPTSYVSDFVGRILTGSATSFSIAPSSSSSASSSSTKSNVFDSLTGAPLPESAKVVNFQDNEVYEVDGLADFLLTMQEVRSPATGRNLNEKEFEKLAETQNGVIKQCLMNTFKSASKTSSTSRSIGSIKTTYFEETIYTMVLHCLSICELDQVTNAHSSILDFNKRYFPKTIRSFSGLSLANPTRLLKICSNVLGQLKTVLESVADVNDQEKENASSYLYHPVVLQSVCSALIGVCNLSASQYFSSPSPDKYSAKICEVPVARLVQTQAISRIVSRRDT